MTSLSYHKYLCSQKWSINLDLSDPTSAVTLPNNAVFDVDQVFWIKICLPFSKVSQLATVTKCYTKLYWVNFSECQTKFREIIFLDRWKLGRFRFTSQEQKPAKSAGLIENASDRCLKTFLSAIISRTKREKIFTPKWYGITKRSRRIWHHKRKRLPKATKSGCCQYHKRFGMKCHYLASLHKNKRDHSCPVHDSFRIVNITILAT